MAGGYMKYRTLSRSSAHRQALLRNMVSSLIKHESISTTWHKAKEAQRLAEKLITLGKKNTEASRRAALAIFYEPHSLLPKLFGPLRERYQNRPGGYTRVLRLEPLKEDQAASAILELVDGPKDMRFAMTARTLARIRSKGHEMNEVTRGNVAKVTSYRAAGEQELEEMVGRMKRDLDLDERGAGRGGSGKVSAEEQDDEDEAGWEDVGAWSKRFSEDELERTVRRKTRVYPEQQQSR